MNKTKRQILDHALVLFNTKGYAQVSLREIALASAISLGNLTYHFKRREDLVEVLYYEFIEETNLRIGNENLNHVDVLHLFNMVADMMKIRIKYQFLTQDMLSISAEKDNIKTHYNHVLQIRKAQILEYLLALQEAKLFRKPELDFEYEFLYERIQIISTFWFSSLILSEQQQNSEVFKGYFQMIIQMIYPYLTDDGKIHWNEVYNNFRISFP